MEDKNRTDGKQKSQEGDSQYNEPQTLANDGPPKSSGGLFTKPNVSSSAIAGFESHPGGSLGPLTQPGPSLFNQRTTSSLFGNVQPNPSQPKPVQFGFENPGLFESFQAVPQNSLNAQRTLPGSQPSLFQQNPPFLQNPQPFQGFNHPGLFPVSHEKATNPGLTSHPIPFQQIQPPIPAKNTNPFLSTTKIDPGFDPSARQNLFGPPPPNLPLPPQVSKSPFFQHPRNPDPLFNQGKGYPYHDEVTGTVFVNTIAADPQYAGLSVEEIRYGSSARNPHASQSQQPVIPVPWNIPAPNLPPRRSEELRWDGDKLWINLGANYVLAGCGFAALVPQTNLILVLLLAALFLLLNKKSVQINIQNNS